MGVPADLPRPLREVVLRYGGEPVHWWREAHRAYILLDSPDGPLFARYSTDAADIRVLDHEARMRARLQRVDGFRTPAVFAAGRGWLLEQRIDADPVGGPAWVDAAVRAAVAIAELDLPTLPGEAPRSVLRRRVRLVVQTVRSPLPLSDVLAARRLAAAGGLPERTGHGDFHPGNLLVSRGITWVVDWELAGPQPAGYDLMHLCSALDDPDDAERTFEAAVAWLGEGFRGELAKLRFVVAVRTLTAKLFPEHAFDRDQAGAARLLAALPELRAAAGLKERA